MITFRVNTGGLDRLIKKLDSFEKSLVDATPLWRMLLTDLKEYEEAVFSNQGFGKWPTYQESFADPFEAQKYMSFKESVSPGSSLTLLVLKGKLKESLTTSKANLFMSPRRFTFGTRVKYAAAMQYGSDWSNSKPRPFLEWNAPLVNLVKKDAELFAKKRVGRFFNG